MNDTSSTMYIDYGDIGTSTAVTTSYTDGMMWIDSSTTAGDTLTLPLKNRYDEPAPVSECSVTYDPIKKKFVVCRGLEYQDKEFKTKRSALRYVKRVEQGRSKVKKDTIKRLKAKNEENKINIAREARQAREYAEIVERMRIEAEERQERYLLEQEARELEEERLENENEEEHYFERLGL